MNKIITSGLIAAAAATTLSACNPTVSGHAASQNGVAGASTVNGASTSGSGAKSQVGHQYTFAQQNAIDSAESYLSMGNGFSRAGLIDQLSSSAGEGFKRADAVFAVNHLSVDWNQQAVDSAKAYLSMGNGFSRAGLIGQLSSKAGEQFTPAQAQYAANHVGLAAATRSRTSAPAGSAYTVAEQNAIASAKSYLSMGNGISRAGLIDQLSSSSGEGFTKADAEFAVDHIKVDWNQQAVESAKSYLQMGSGFSRAELIDQLSSKAGDQFTLSQAEYAVSKVGL